MSTKKSYPPSTSFEAMKEKLLRDPEVKKAYDAEKLSEKRKATKRKTAKSKAR